MKSPYEIASDHGFQLTSYANGQHYTTCPQCSRQRSRTGQPKKCLSVLICGDGIRWCCHHCGAAGGAYYDPHRRNVQVARRIAPASLELPPLPTSIDRHSPIWNRATPARGTIVEAYLRSRSICVLPSCIRYHPHCPMPQSGFHPAMVAAVINPRTRERVAIQRTALKPDGLGKAKVDTQKASLGPTKGAGIVIGSLSGHDLVAIGEGLETVLSAVQAADLDGVATLSKGALGSVELPDTVREVILLSEAGSEAAYDRAADLLSRRGLNVRIACMEACP